MKSSEILRSMNRLQLASRAGSLLPPALLRGVSSHLRGFATAGSAVGRGKGHWEHRDVLVTIDVWHPWRSGHGAGSMLTEGWQEFEHLEMQERWADAPNLEQVASKADSQVGDRGDLREDAQASQHPSPQSRKSAPTAGNVFYQPEKLPGAGVEPLGP